ncbi:MAG TPA: PAS domain S-box protein [Crenalkalicoccus sp.]|nr:PAS domain S-box protein [Crenalkalicoccus sp.]
MLDAVPVAAVLLDPRDLNLVAANDEVARLLGCPATAEAWTGALAISPDGPALRARLAIVESHTAPEVFDAGLPGAGDLVRRVLVRARHVEIEGRPLLSVGFVDITRRQRAETALAAANARLGAVLQCGEIGVWEWRVGEGRVTVSALCSGMLGLGSTASEIALQEWEALLHPEDRDEVLERLEAHVAGDTSGYHAEYRLRHRDGRWITVLAHGRATERDAQRRARVVVGTLMDITRRRHAEQAAEADAARLRALLEANPIAMLRCRMDGPVLDANAAFLRLVGATREELEAGRLHSLALTAPECRGADAAALAEAAKRGFCRPYEKAYLLPDGRRVPVLFGFAFLDRRAGELAAFALDLSDLRRSERARAASEREARRRLAELETLYRSAPLGLAQLDGELRFVRVNEALAQMNGFSAEAHLGRCVWDLVPDLRASGEPLVRRVLQTGESLTGIEISGETPAAPGLKRDWLEQFYPVRDPETGEVMGVGLVCEEVTERKRTERTQSLLLRELDHRVKNLFAVISGLVSFTARSAATPRDMAQAVLGRIGALARAHDLVRPAMTGLSANAGGTTLAELLESLLAPFRPAFGQPERLRIGGPPVRLGQVGAPPVALVLHELATNAAKHGALSGRGGRLEVRWEAGRPGPNAMLRLAWTERAAQPVAPPRAHGFGQRLIAQSVSQLGGSVALDWRPEGLAAEFLLPLERLAR